MNDTATRYLTGTGFMICAGCLNYLGQSVFSIIPAVAGVVVLGSLLLDKIREGK